MKNTEKYTKNYFLPPELCVDWTHQDSITKAPAWCSVDLRDGNQALVVPMTLEEKIEFFQFLVKMGFKEIEVGFPAASETEYEFVRALIEQDLIPDDVVIQVLTQSREHIIQKTFQSLEGCKKAVVHLYNSTSVAQREQVFQKSREEVIEIAVSGAKLLKQYAKMMKGDFLFEYSPESFTGTEMDFALEICNAVLDVWKPVPHKKVIINLPVTVSLSMPHVYASQVEYMSKHLNYRDSVVLSLHPHNDRGCAVADAEMGLLAGGERIEGTLFGNGERTGNVDIVTLALNMYSQGVDPGLDFSNVPEVVDIYEEMTGMKVGERQPYGGRLVFAAFSGSHQDAIAKGMKWRKEKECLHWSVPYLPLDPQDIGRQYDGDVIRINSQSGKGGIGYLMEKKYGFDMPKKMQEFFGYHIKSVSDHQHRELCSEEIYGIFLQNFVNSETPVTFHSAHFIHPDDFEATVAVAVRGVPQEFKAWGNGRLDAVSTALQRGLQLDYSLVTYKEHALDTSTKSRAAAYVGIVDRHNHAYWGVGIHYDIITASVKALISAINNMMKEERKEQQ